MQIAILTISDRCSQGHMQDTAGPAVAQILQQQWPPATITVEILPDDSPAIIAALNQHIHQNAALILTVGGTGLGPRDHTPEATRQVIDREAPGIAEAIRTLGAQLNPYAWLSRGIAGIKDVSLIVNLPGSQRGAEQSITAILPLLKHALEVMTGSQSHP